jgi:hypothetical protein
LEWLKPHAGSAIGLAGLMRLCQITRTLGNQLFHRNGPVYQAQIVLQLYWPESDQHEAGADAVGVVILVTSFTDSEDTQFSKVRGELPLPELCAAPFQQARSAGGLCAQSISTNSPGRFIMLNGIHPIGIVN